MLLQSGPEPSQGFVDGTIEDSYVEDLSDRTQQRPIHDVLLQRDMGYGITARKVFGAVGAGW